MSYVRNIGKYEYGVSLIYETEFLSDLKLDIPFLKSAKKTNLLKLSLLFVRY